jgi:hypothetical protein
MPTQRSSTASSAAAPFTISRTRIVTDIDAIDDVAGFARVNGREVAVHHLDAITYRALRMLAEDPNGFNVLEVYDAAHRACPELTRDEIDRLSATKVAAILAVAEAGVKAVEDQIPNAPGPTTEATTEMTSSPSA